MGALADRFNLEKQLVFYLSYHDDKVNQWIHFCCIWPILITALTMFADTEALAPTPAFLSALPYGDYIVLNYSAVIAAVYMAWYILLDPLYVLCRILRCHGLLIARCSLVRLSLFLCVLAHFACNP